MQSPLATANQAYQKGQTTAAMAGYVNAFLKMPELGKSIAGNISRTRQQYLNSRNNSEPPKVVICGWELAHNAAGRAHTLAEIYREITSDVEIVGSIFPRWGTEVWEPIRGTSTPIHAFVVEPDCFIEQALTMVAAYPADVVHLSKPRAPNIFFGIFYKLLWGAKVIVDIDDEELAFVKAETPLSLSAYLKEYPTLPPLEQITEVHWTRIAVGLVGEFDGITVSNSALQNRYGGVVIGHARDPKTLQPSPELRQISREALGILPNQKVVLFSGTPRPHKGLLEVAEAIQSLNRDDIVFVIAGSFGEKHMKFKAMLQAVAGINYIFLENQPIASLTRILAIADCCVLFQATNSSISTYQMPAKLSDALAMRVPVLVSTTVALEVPIAFGAVIPTAADNLAFKLAATLDHPNQDQRDMGHRYFFRYLSLDVCASRMKEIVRDWHGNQISQLLRQVLATVQNARCINLL